MRTNNTPERAVAPPAQSTKRALVYGFFGAKIGFDMAVSGIHTVNNVIRFDEPGAQHEAMAFESSMVSLLFDIALALVAFPKASVTESAITLVGMTVGATTALAINFATVATAPRP